MMEELEIRRVDCRRCKSVKQERLEWLADNPLYKRFAFYVGRRCRDSAIRDVARELHPDWKTVKALEKQYMQEHLKRAGQPGPKVIGINEVAIRKGHTYRIVVSDLLRQRDRYYRLRVSHFVYPLFIWYQRLLLQPSLSPYLSPQH